MANNYTQATVTPDLPVTLFSEADLASLASCGLRYESAGDMLYFFADECFCEEGEDEAGSRVNGIALLQSRLRLLDPAETPHIAVEGATTCDKMRPGEFGGFAYFITRKAVRYVSTWQWLAGKRNRQAAKGAIVRNP